MTFVFHIYKVGRLNESIKNKLAAGLDIANKAIQTSHNVPTY